MRIEEEELFFNSIFSRLHINMSLELRRRRRRRKNKRQALEKQNEFYHSIVDHALEHVQLGPLSKC